jgi:hypothetical protein
MGSGSPAILLIEGPVALRRRLTPGLPFSESLMKLLTALAASRVIGAFREICCLVIESKFRHLTAVKLAA